MSDTTEYMNTVSIADAATLMELVVGESFINGKQPGNVMVWGSPGGGKSAITHQLRAKLEARLKKPVHLIDLRLSAMDSSDVQGIPYNAKTGRKISAEIFDENGDLTETLVDEQDMFFSTPAWWPKDPNAYYILFLDELPNCPIHVQHAAYRLILDKSVQNGKTLGNNVAIIAAGNLKSDKTGARDLAPAAANRFAMHLMIDSKNAADAFLDYAVNKQFDPSIVGFLNWKGSSVYSAPEERQKEQAWASPRSWEFGDGHLKNKALRSNEHFLRVALAGCIGTTITSQFIGYLQYHNQLPDWKKIRSGKESYTIPDGEDQLAFAVSTTLAFEMISALASTDDENVDKAKVTSEVTNLTNVVKQLPPELRIVFFKTMKRDFRIMLKFMEFDDLHAEFKKVSAHIQK